MIIVGSEELKKTRLINYLNLDFDLMAAYVCPAALAHDNGEACMLCVNRNFECQVTLSKTSLEE
jgi:hypothetical protein